MPAITSALMALRLSGRLIVIQNAWSRFSCSTSADASVIGTPYVAARRSPRGGASALGTARRRSLEPPTSLRAGPPEGERAPWERPGGGHWNPLRRCAPVPPRGSERLGNGPAAVIGTPYVAARRSPRGGASALGTARRRSLEPPTSL